MLNPINTSLAPLLNNHFLQNEPAPGRNRRSIEQPRIEGPAIDFSGVSANDRPRSSGTLDSLGGGRLL